MIYSADDDPSRPSPALFETALAAINEARGISLSEISERLREPPLYPDIWPGEHYRLLAAFIRVLQPKLVVEIGTATGLSALTMKRFLGSDAKLLTFDIVPWDQFPQTCLRAEDFEDGRLVQYIADLSKPWNMKLFESMIRPAGLIFIDAAKDGTGEQDFIDLLRPVQFESVPFVLFDDIRLWNMLAIWRRITAPKLDLTSFGHWSGTGIVEWRWT